MPLGANTRGGASALLTRSVHPPAPPCVRSVCQVSACAARGASSTARRKPSPLPSYAKRPSHLKTKVRHPPGAPASRTLLCVLLTAPPQTGMRLARQVSARAAREAGSTAWRRCAKGLLGNMRLCAGGGSGGDGSALDSASTRASQSPVPAPHKPRSARPFCMRNGAEAPFVLLVLKAPPYIAACVQRW